jgi:hypothetical protein
MNANCVLRGAAGRELEQVVEPLAKLYLCHRAAANRFEFSFSSSFP